MQGTSYESSPSRDSSGLKDNIYHGKQAIKEVVDLKLDQTKLKYHRASNAIRNFLRFYGFIHYIKYDGTEESFRLLV